MLHAVGLLLVLLSPTLAGVAVLHLPRLVGRLRRRRRRPEPVAAPVPLERLAADLRRLRARLDDVERGDAERPGPGRGTRLRALHAAYGDRLAAACRVLEVPLGLPPAHDRLARALARHEGDGRAGGDHGAPPVPSRHDFPRLEAALHAAGLDVRTLPVG